MTVISGGAFDSLQNNSVSWPLFELAIQESHIVTFPFSLKLETVSQPVKEWNQGRLWLKKQISQIKSYSLIISFFGQAQWQTSVY